LTIEDRVTLAEARAALERGRPVVLVCPPAPERAKDVWDLIGPVDQERGPGGPGVLILCADDVAAADWSRAAPPEQRVHAVTGLAASARVLKQGSVPVLAGAAKDVAALVERSALKLDTVSTVLIAWPEGLLLGDHASAIDTLLGEVRDARRIVLSWNPAQLGDFLERHARRALVEGTPPVDEAGAKCRARYAIVPPFSRGVAARDVLDALGAASSFVWERGPVTPPATRPGVVVCTALPTRDELEALARLGGGEPVLLISAAQLPYLRSVATLTPLSLPSGADRARDRAEALRERVRQVLTDGSVDAELALLDPLFERFDAAEVAAALLALQRKEHAGAAGPTVPPPPPPLPAPAELARAKLFINVGRKDRASAKDLVGALIREAGVAKGDIGRIEVRDSFSLVEVAGAAAQRALQGLAGVTIRGRRVAARLDREG
jgi:hypothetical protein